MQKKYTIIVLVFLIIITSSALVYLYSKSHNSNSNKIERIETLIEKGKTDGQQATILVSSSSSVIVENKDLKIGKGKVFGYENSSYEKLTQEEKLILDSFVINESKEFRKRHPEYDYTVYADNFRASNARLVYYDESKIIAYIPPAKGTWSSSLSIKDRYTFKNIEDGSKTCKLNIGAEGVQIFAKEYVVSVSNDGGICYYKAGDVTFTSVLNSALPQKSKFKGVPSDPNLATEIEAMNKKALQFNPKGESYTVPADMGWESGEVSFDEKSKTLIVGVFRTNPNEILPKPATIRSVKFVLK